MNLRGITLLLALCLFTSSCGTQRARRAPDIGRDEITAVSGIDWYIDATPSLQGFVTSARTKTYEEFLKALDARNITLFPPTTYASSFSRFGTEVESFQTLSEAYKAEFYALRKGFENTNLEIVAKRLNPKALSIVITDLFQSDDNIESFRRELVRKGLGSRLQIGVVALQARFDGTIHDVPPAKSSIRSSRPRPVYAIVLGPPQPVRRLVRDVLRKGLDDGTEIVGLMISALVGEVLVPIAKLPDSGAAAAWHSQGFYKTRDLVEGGQQDHIREIRLPSSPCLNRAF